MHLSEASTDWQLFMARLPTEVVMEEDVTGDFGSDGDCRCAEPPRPPPAPPHFFCNEIPDAHMCLPEMSMESHLASEPGSMAVLIVCVLLMVAFLVAGLMIWRHKKKVQTLLPCHKQPPPRREIPCPTEDTTMFRPQGPNSRETLAINNALELNDMKILNYGCADKLIPNHGILYVKAKDKEHFNPIYEEVSACSDSKMHPCEEDSDDTQHEVATIGSEEDYTEDEVDLIDYKKRLSQDSRLESGSACSSSSENKSPKSSPSLRTSSGSLHSKSSGISLPRFAIKESGISVTEQPRTKMGYQGIRTSLPRDYHHKPPPPKDLRHPTTLPYVPKREWQRVPANSNTYPRPRSSSSNNGSQSSLPQSDHSSSPSASSESISDSEHQSAFMRDRTEPGLVGNQRRTSFSKTDPRGETTPLTLPNKGQMPNSKMHYRGSNPSHKFRDSKPQPAPRYRMRQSQGSRPHPPSLSHNALSRGGDPNKEASRWNAQFSDGERRTPNYNDSLRKSRFSDSERRPPYSERSKRNSQYSDSLKRNSHFGGGKRNSHLSDGEKHYSYHSDGEKQNCWDKDDHRISDSEHLNCKLSDSESSPPMSNVLRSSSGLPPETLTELKTKLKRFNPPPRSNAPSISQERIC